MTDHDFEDESTPKHAVRNRRIRVYVTPEQKETIVDNAQECGLTVSAYARNLALGYKPASILDLKEARKLIALKADLGRLGGLLKLWLSDPIQYNEKHGEPIEDLMAKITEAQDRLLAVIRRIHETTR